MSETLTEEQQRLLMQGLPLNNPVPIPQISPEIQQMAAQQQQPQMTNAQQLLAEYAKPREFQAPGSFGEGVTNAFQNVLVRPLQESLGIRESAADTLRRLQGNAARLDYANTYEERQRRALADRIAMGVDLTKYPAQIQRAYLSTVQQSPTDAFKLLTEYDQRFKNPETDSYQFAQGLDNPEDYFGYLDRRKAQTNINTATNPAAKASVEAFNKQASEYREASNLAYSSDTQVGLMQELLGSGALKTGAGQEAILQARRIANTLGFDAGKTAPGELFAALSAQIVIPLVKQLGVNPTDKDLQFIIEATASLGKSEAGNRLLLQTLEFSNDRNKALYEASLDFQSENADLQISNPAMYKVRFEQHMNQARRSPAFAQKTLELRRQFNLLEKGPNFAETGTGEAAADAILGNVAGASNG
tara:strand:+ start:716 stop:1966 length:1251 start_codon:yes stop_codon:yes gene_type:complete